MSRYNFKKDDVSYTLDMTGSFTNLYFLGGDISYEDADFYAYYDFSDFTPSGCLDSGYIVDPPNYSAKEIKAIPNRGLKIDKNANCTLRLYWFSNLNTPFYSTGSSYSGIYEYVNGRGISPRREGIHWECSAHSGYVFLDGTSYKEGDINFYTSTFVNENISGSDCKWWYSLPSLVTKVNTCIVTFTKGTGVRDLWIYTTNDPTPGSTRYTSGSAFPRNSTVYLCVEWETGYKPPNNQWYEKNTAVGYIRYKIINVPDNANYDLGTINMVVAESSVSDSKGSSWTGTNVSWAFRAVTSPTPDDIPVNAYLTVTQNMIDNYLRWELSVSSGSGSITYSDSVLMQATISKSSVGPSVFVSYYYTDSSWIPLT